MLLIAGQANNALNTMLGGSRAGEVTGAQPAPTKLNKDEFVGYVSEALIKAAPQTAGIQK